MNNKILAQNHSYVTKKLHILIADDEMHYHQQAHQLLRKQPEHIENTFNTKTIRDTLLQLLLQPIDLLLMDVQFEAELATGIELCRYIKKGFIPLSLFPSMLQSINGGIPEKTFNKLFIAQPYNSTSLRQTNISPEITAELSPDQIQSYLELCAIEKMFLSIRESLSIIIFTNQAHDKTIREAATAAGANDCLDKSYDSATVQGRITQEISNLVSRKTLSQAFAARENDLRLKESELAAAAHQLRESKELLLEYKSGASITDHTLQNLIVEAGISQAKMDWNSFGILYKKIISRITGYLHRSRQGDFRPNWDFPSSLTDTFLEVKKHHESLGLLNRNGASFELINLYNQDVLIPMDPAYLGDDVLQNLIKDSYKFFKLYSPQYQQFLSIQDIRTIPEELHQLLFTAHPPHSVLPHELFYSISSLEAYANQHNPKNQELQTINTLPELVLHDYQGRISLPRLYGALAALNQNATEAQALFESILTWHVAQVTQNILGKNHPEAEKIIYTFLRERHIVWIEIPKQTDADYVSFYYCDNGSGVPDEWIIATEHLKQLNAEERKLITREQINSEWIALSMIPEKLATKAIRRKEAIYGQLSTSPQDNSALHKNGGMTLRHLASSLLGSIEEIGIPGYGIRHKITYRKKPLEE